MAKYKGGPSLKPGAPQRVGKSIVTPQDNTGGFTVTKSNRGK